MIIPNKKASGASFASYSVRFARLLFAGMLAAGFGSAIGLAQEKKADKEEDSEIVELSAFEVVADASDRYEALNISSLSGTNKSLEKLPITAEIITQALMEDLATTDVRNLLTNHATGITPGEFSPGSSSAAGRGDADRFTLFTLGIRGLNAGAARRNGFLTFGWQSEGYNMERMEVIRGPQALIYGTNPPGGIVNIVTKKAFFGKSWAKPMIRVDSNGSEHYQLDANVSGHWHKNNRFAVRTALLKTNTNYWQDSLGRDSDGQYVEAAMELHRPTQTTLRLEWESSTTHMVHGSQQFRIYGAQAIAGVPDGSVLSLMLANKDPRLEDIAGGMISWKNVESLMGSTASYRVVQKYLSASLSTRLTPWLEAQVVATTTDRNFRQSQSNGNLFRAPGTGSNTSSAWGMGVRPYIWDTSMDPKGIRAMLSADFKTGRLAKHNLVAGWEKTKNRQTGYNYYYYETDGNENIKVDPDPAHQNTADRGRTQMPYVYSDISQGMPHWVNLARDSYTINGVTYNLERQKSADPALATPGNPLGLNGGTTGVTDTESSGWGAFGALFSTWMNGRIETLLGLRYDNRDSSNAVMGQNIHDSGFSGNAGFVWNIWKSLALYGSYSSNINPSGGGVQLDGRLIPNGEGHAFETGVKINAHGGRLSGSVAVYDMVSKNETLRLPGTARNATDPNGINGIHYNTTDPFLCFDRESKGFEVSVTSRPWRNLRLQLGYSLSMAKNVNSVSLPYLYNDEFRTNAQGEVLLADGTPLRVPVDTSIAVASDGKTYAPGVATQVITLDVLRNGDSDGHYKANISSDNGRILNSDALGLLVPGVGTGRTGLPISQHQLGFVPTSGEGLPVVNGNDRATGHPRHALTFTASYGVRSGIFKGLGYGANIVKNWDTVLYYYTDTTDNNNIKQFKIRNQFMLHLFASYDFKLSRNVSWKIQLNVGNVGDSRYMEVLPNVATGISDNARLMRGPRTWTLTNTLSF